MALKQKSTKAIAYLRTSSAANVGADKDRDKRQREAISALLAGPTLRSLKSSTMLT